MSISSFNLGLIRVVIESFGYLHGPPPTADITIDVRQIARDPHTSIEMRELTGLEPVVKNNVLCHSAAIEVISVCRHLVEAFLPVKQATNGLVRIAFGCAGGRHRSVVIANELMCQLMANGIGTDVTHRDILKPVVDRK
jgi:UPF0042 nucleotide-binding protein